MTTTRTIAILLAATLLAACGKEPGPGSGDESSVENVTVKIVPDRTSFINNPLNGWVMYLGRSWDENFWTSQGYDAIKTSEGNTVKVSDYAGIAYLRTNWAMLEPSEGNYTWRDPDSRIYKLFKSCTDRGMRLAFRIVIDGRDQGQNTPLYVINAGAKYYTEGGGTHKTPYPEDPVFQAKFTKFIQEFAKDFNDPAKVDFIDGFSLGKWGEAHALIFQDNSHKREVFEWFTSLYADNFTNIPLFVNYHRLVGDPNQNSWTDTVPSDTEPMLESAIAKGYSLRHDAFGMTGYYKSWEKAFVKAWNFKRPVAMEGGWITGGTHRYWIDPSNAYREGHPEDVRQGEYDASAEARVNLMDLRVGDETASWFGKCFNLMQDFIGKGGYRLYPDQVSVPESAKTGDIITISHRWVNLGWGYCPTNIPQWNQRYKVAFALLSATDRPVKVFVAEDTDLSTWLNAKPTSYKTQIQISGVPVGEYKWAVGLVDTTRGNEPGIHMAVESKRLTKDGWARINTITIK